MEKYTKVRNIGTGNMGACALARNNEDGKLYVVKQVDLSRMSKKERQQSLNEARLLSSLRHPNVIRYVDSFLARRSNHLCIVMEYADGGDLNARIKKSAGVNFGEGQVLDWFIQLALSLHYVHQRKILHRDVKAQNIFLTSDNVVKLGDFGIARTLSNTYDQAKTFVGTPYYLSPELILERPYDTRSDVWALGVVLYELLTLRHPFNANDMRGLMQRILRVQYEPVSLLYSAELRHVLTRLLVKEPSQRAHLGEVLELPVVQRRLCEWVQRRSALPHAYVDALIAQNLLPASVMQTLHPTPSSQAPLSSCHAQGLTTTTAAATSAVTAAAAVAAAAAATAREAAAAAATAAATHTAAAAASRDDKAVGVDDHGGSHVRERRRSSSNDSSSSSDGDDVAGSRRAAALAAMTAAAAPVVASVNAQPQHETSSAHNGGGGVFMPRPTAQLPPPPPPPSSSTPAAAALQPQEPPPLLPPRASAAGAAVYARQRARLPSYVLDLWHPVGNAAAAVGAASAAALSRPTQLAYAPRAYAQPPLQPPPAPSCPPCTARPARLPARSHVSARAAAAAAAAAGGSGGLLSRQRAEAPTVVTTTSMKSSNNNNNSDNNVGGGVYSFAGGGGGACYRTARGSAVSAAKSSKGGNVSTSNDGGSDAVERHRVRALPLSPSPPSLSIAQPLGLPWSLLTPAPVAMKERAAGAAAAAASGGNNGSSSRATAATAAAAAAAVAAGVYSARVPHNALPSLAARATPLREMRLLAAMEPLYAPYRTPPQPQQQQPQQQQQQQQQQQSSLCTPASHVVTRHMLRVSNNNNNNNNNGAGGGLQSSNIASKAGRHLLQPLPQQQQQQSSSSLPPHSAQPSTPTTTTTAATSSTTTSTRGESDDASSGRAQVSTYAAAPQHTLCPATGAGRPLPPAVQRTTAATASAAAAAAAALPLSSSPLDVDKSSGRQVNTTTTATSSSPPALPPLLRPPRCLQPAPMADVRQLLHRAAQDRARRQLPGYT